MSTQTMIGTAAAAAPQNPSATPGTGNGAAGGAAPTTTGAPAAGGEGADKSTASATPNTPTTTATEGSAEGEPTKEGEQAPKESPKVDLPEGFADVAKAMGAEGLVEALQGGDPAKVAGAVMEHWQAQAKAKDEQITKWQAEIKARPHFGAELEGINVLLTRIDKDGAFAKAMEDPLLGDNPAVWSFLAQLASIDPKEDRSVGLGEGRGKTPVDLTGLPLDHPEVSKLIDHNTDYSKYGRR